METIKLNDELKKRILAIIDSKNGHVFYEKKYSYLQKEELSIKEFGSIFQMLLKEAQATKAVFEIPSDEEFASAFQKAYVQLDKGPINPGDLQDLRYRVSFEEYISEVIKSMGDCLDVIELGQKYDLVLDLRILAENAIGSIDGLEKYKIKVSPEVSSQMYEIQKRLKILLSTKPTDTQGIKQEIDKYNEHALAIWDDYLSQSENGENSGFRWIIHNLTHGKLEGNFKDKYMSTSLITNNAMGVFGRNKYGLKIKPKHIVAASNRDVATANDGNGWGLDSERLFLTLPAPIMLPQEVEQKCIQDTIKANGEMLNYDEVTIYPEIVVDDFEIDGIYYISNGEHELAPDYEDAKNLADERGLELHELDISEERTKHGLQPMTEKMKKEFSYNILWKCCKNNESLKRAYERYAESFVEEHYQEFSERYIELKEKGNYTQEDILRVFAEIARGDLHFGEIAKNIDEQYSKRIETDKEEEAISESSIDTTVVEHKTEEKKTGESDSLRFPKDKWMNRFSKWYGVIDRVNPNFRSSILKIRHDIAQTIAGLFKHRNNSKANKDKKEKSKEETNEI